MWSHFPRMNIFHFVSIARFFNLWWFPQYICSGIPNVNSAADKQNLKFYSSYLSMSSVSSKCDSGKYKLLKITECQHNNNLKMERKNMFNYCCAICFKYRAGRVILQEYQAFSVSSAFLYDLSGLKEQSQHIPVDLVTHRGRAILLQFQMIIGLVWSLPN